MYLKKKNNLKTKNFILSWESFDLLFMYIFQILSSTVYAPS